MPASKLTRRLFWATELVLLVGSVAVAVLISSPEEWSPLALVVLLLVISLLGQWFSVETGSGQLTASFIALILAMGLLGPAPAVACGVAAMILKSAVRRLAPAQWLNNLSTFAFTSLLGGLMVGALAGDIHVVGKQSLAQNVVFGLVLFCSSMITLVGLNFVMFALDVRVDEGRPIGRQVRELFLPLLPGQLATGMLATILAVAYRSIGLSVLFAAVAVLLIVRHLTVALLRSEERAEQLEARSMQLVGLQLGVLRTLVRALGMRDKTSGRHAATVARYARALATEIGCSEEERDVVHSAGLLHEIGKFTWPDRILHAEVIEDQDLAIVKNHPQEGAILVGALDGYGEVADAILYHHERVDGRGYPAGLIGKEIPLASRILAICSTYDTMTSRESYRPSMPPEEATAELRRAAENGQLDPELVEVFVALVDREAATLAEDADFETELDFERRVREMAEPRSAGPSSTTEHTSPPRRSGLAVSRPRSTGKG